MQESSVFMRRRRILRRPSYSSIFAVTRFNIEIIPRTSATSLILRKCAGSRFSAASQRSQSQSGQGRLPDTDSQNSSLGFCEATISGQRWPAILRRTDLCWPTSISQVSAYLILRALDCTFALKQSRLVSDGICDICDGVCALLITEFDLAT